MSAEPNRAVLHWTAMLTGLEGERVTEALQRVASWKSEALSHEMLAPTIDAAVAATLMVEGFDYLVEHGANEAQLRKKVRQDRQVWGTWAEIRAADVLLRSMPDAELRIEEGRSRGAHADLRFVLPEGAMATSVEVKAIGLSDEEVAFCETMAPALRALTPKVGLGHVHAAIGSAPPQRPRLLRMEGQAVAKRGAKGAPRYPQGLRGAAIVGHGSEESYARRVARRVVQAVRQLPPADDCWVAILWSNGAPMTALHASIPWNEIPRHVSGIVLVGSGVAFPHREIHMYTHVIHREADFDERPKLESLDGPDMEKLAEIIRMRFERSSGVRPTLLKGGDRTVLFRDGRRRILPFNLLLDADPEPLGRGASYPTSVQAEG